MTMGQWRHTTTTGRRRLSALFVAAILVLAIPVALGTAGAAPGQRIDLKVLVVAHDANDAVAQAWKSSLDGEGVPNDLRVLNAGTPDLTDGDLGDYGANRAYYQAVIVAWGDMPLADGERAALNKLQTTFGVRKLLDNKQPGPDVGMTVPSNVGEQGPGTATLTDAGKALFPYLNGTIPIDQFAFGYRATPANPAYTKLVGGPSNSSYLGTFTHPDGRQEMVSALTGNGSQTHFQFLRHGVISWLTGGVFLGHQRNYFETQVDDIFLPNDRWDMVENKTGVDEPTSSPDEYQCDRDPETPIRECLPAIRMTAADVTRLINWQNANGIKLDMVFNGHGSDEHVQETGSDPLAAALLPQRGQFRWINHTYSHPKLFTTSRGGIVNEIATNVQWAAAHGITIDPSELVTGEHSGLDNPEMPGALADTGIKWIASDNSRESSQRAIGPAITVPRFPSNVYYNVGTSQEQLDEYNYIYLPPSLGGKCVNTPTNTCRDAPATWEEYVDSEANIMFDHVMGNDPRPHYAHQSNLVVEAGTPTDPEPVLFSVLNAALARYRPYLNVPIVQLSHTQIGDQLQRRSQWNANRGEVSAYLQDGQVHFTNNSTHAIEVPITGTAIGDDYGGQRSGWVTIAGRSSQTTPAPPAAKNPVRMSLTGLKIKPKRFATTGRRKGATVSWRVSHAGTLKLAVQRKTRGRKVGKSCKKQTRRNRKRKACTRYVSVGTITRSAKQGNGRYKWTGKVKRRRLKTGNYRLVGTATAKDRSVLPSAAGRVTFKVVKAKKAKSKRR
jgi:hypothetical protein